MMTLTEQMNEAERLLNEAQEHVRIAREYTAEAMKALFRPIELTPPTPIQWPTEEQAYCQSLTDDGKVAHA